MNFLSTWVTEILKDFKDLSLREKWAPSSNDISQFCSLKKWNISNFLFLKVSFRWIWRRWRWTWLNRGSRCASTRFWGLKMMSSSSTSSVSSRRKTSTQRLCRYGNQKERSCLERNTHTFFIGGFLQKKPPKILLLRLAFRELSIEMLFRVDFWNKLIKKITCFFFFKGLPPTFYFPKVISKSEAFRTSKFKFFFSRRSTSLGSWTPVRHASSWASCGFCWSRPTRLRMEFPRVWSRKSSRRWSWTSQTGMKQK